MKLKALIFPLLVSLLLFCSCDSKLMTTVSLSTELSDLEYSIVDYDFALAAAGDTDHLYFEFVVNKVLDQSTPIVFFDQSGNVLASKDAGEALRLISTNIDSSAVRSFAYSVTLENLRSVSLIHRVNIGN